MRNQVWIQVRSETSFYFFTHKMKMAIKQQQQQSKKKKQKNEDGNSYFSGLWVSNEHVVSV